MLATWTFVLLGSLPAIAAPLRPEDALGNVGESATVASSHHDARPRSQPTFLNLGKAYPAQIFTAMVFALSRAKSETPL